MKNLLTARYILLWGIISVALLLLGFYLQRLLITDELIIKTLRNLGILEENLLATLAKSSQSKDWYVYIYMFSLVVGLSFNAIFVISVAKFLYKEDTIPNSQLFNLFMMAHWVVPLAYITKYFLFEGNTDYTIIEGENYIPLSLQDFFPRTDHVPVYTALGNLSIFKVSAAVLWAILIDQVLKLPALARIVLISYSIFLLLVNGFLIAISW